MKKTVKSLIIATSVAAIAGIGAVSFAAWNNTTKTTTGSAAAGHITLTNGYFVNGDGTAKTLTLNETGKVLMPYDQDDENVPVENGAKALTYAIPDYQISGNYTLTLGVVAKKGENAYTLPEGTKIQYKVNGDAWVDAGTAETTTVDGTDVATVSGKNLTIQLVSSDLADMDITLELTLTYADAT